MTGNGLGERPERSRTSQSVSCFVVGEDRYPAGFVAGRHSHDSAQFCMALKGDCLEKVSGRTWQYQPMSLEFLPPGEAHSLESREGVHSFNVTIPISGLSRVREYRLAADTLLHCNGGPLAQILLRMRREFIQMDAASPLAIEGLIFELLAEVSRNKVNRPEPKAPPWLQQARELLHANFTESVTLTELSEAVGIHPVHLSRQFHRQFGCTVGEYTRRLRVEQACRSLSSTDLSLAKIAASSGFSDQSHFGRAFKEFIGMTPNQYRRAMTGR